MLALERSWFFRLSRGTMFDLFDSQVSGAARSIPFDFVADRIAENCCSDRCQNGKFSLIEVCKFGEGQSPLFSLVGFQIAKLYAGMKGNRSGWKNITIEDQIGRASW